jgi:hypothetical protein
VARIRALVAVLLAGLAGCENAPYTIDEFPIYTDLDAGVPIVIMRSSDIDPDPHTAVVDTSSPITVIDDGTGDVSRRLISLDVLRAPTATTPAQVRARFSAVQAILGTLGEVGEGSGRPITGVLGGDVLSLLALRLDPASSQIQLFPDIAGSTEAHENACESVIGFQVAGGGTYVNGVDRVRFLPTRIVLGVCMNADPVLPVCTDSATSCVPSGADTLLLLATGVGPTILSRTAFQRVTGLAGAAIDALPTTPVFLGASATPQVLHHTTVSRYALVGHEGPRGPCAELFTRRLLQRDACPDAMVTAGTCPCADNANDCAAGSTVELSRDIDVAMIEDTDPLLQGLRDELRPAVADIDGLLGMSAFGGMVTDLDYPDGRAIVRCPAGADPATCTTRPRISDQGRVRDLRDAWKCLPKF